MPAGSRIIELDEFVSAALFDGEDQERLARRFSTLIDVPNESSLHGGSGNVVHVRNVFGEDIALKSLLIKRDPWEDRTVDPAQFVRRRESFENEYLVHQTLAGVEGFPVLYGRGIYDGGPVILMEWIEGLTATAAMERAFKHPCSHGGFPAEAVASLGLAAARVLLAGYAASSGFVHRDISPKNIMVRMGAGRAEEERLPLLGKASRQQASNAHRQNTPAFRLQEADKLRQQFDEQTLHVCVLDMGSACADGAQCRHDRRVYGTAEYAAPEMLAQANEIESTAQNSQDIDVYALCSVLYELYSGCTPYELWRGDQPGSLYQIKSNNTPKELAPKAPEDEPFVRAIISGIRTKPSERSSMQLLASELSVFLAKT